MTTTSTVYWRSGAAGAVSAKELQEAADLLRSGGTVAFPTETVYGLGADARSTAAVESVFQAKGRPSDNPLIVHIADERQLEGLAASLTETERGLMKSFWPGPLTLVLPVLPDAVSPRVTAGLDTVAVRMPDHPLALALIREAGCPVAAPSANRSGRPSPTAASHVLEDLAGRIGGVLDGGATGVGLESTVVEAVGERSVRILRPGGVTPEQLRAAGYAVEFDAGADIEAFGQPASGSAVSETAASQPTAPRSPGMKYAHYAPRGEMTLVSGSAEAVRAYIQAEADAASALGLRTGVLAYEETAASYRADAVLACGSLGKLESAARSLYAVLREFDELGAERIWAEACPSDGIGLALLNRLAKAAGGRQVDAG
ncbi:L-threonylcarbamoyladenylate synthase [Paenibacillus humicus]|uniref:L-threonylcarbamoyladenylate synthase n=1 Tax=Paenibacillus humicus TaxID=412861 RepID=UPI003F1686C1